MFSVIPNNFIIDNNGDIRFATSAILNHNTYSTDSIFSDMRDINIGQYYTATNNMFLKLRDFNSRKIFDVFDEKYIHIAAININIYTFNQKISDGIKCITPPNSRSSSPIYYA